MTERIRNTRERGTVTTSTSEIAALLRKIDATPSGPSERALIDQAVALADEAEEMELAYQARMRLVNSAEITGDTDAMLSAFVWCVGMNESDPVRFPTVLEKHLNLLWFHKWMPGALARSPLFPLDEIERVLDQLSERFTREGVGMSAIAQVRFDEAMLDGRLEEAEHHRLELKRLPRDEYSNCEACLHSTEIEFLALTGRDAEALAVFDEMIERNMRCSDEPAMAIGHALLPLLRAGRLGHARVHQSDGYWRAYRGAENLEIIADHFVFCAVTGDTSSGLSLLARHIRWLAHDGLDSRSHFRALVAIGVLLDALDTAGLAKTAVRGAAAAELLAFFGEHEGRWWSVHDLSVAAWSAASALAERFDERNDNDHYADRIRSARELANERYDLAYERMI